MPMVYLDDSLDGLSALQFKTSSVYSEGGQFARQRMRSLAALCGVEGAGGSW